MFEVNVNGRKQRYRSKPTMNVDTTGSSGDVSIPKPLTYDYMPEGYPKKDGWSIEWDGNTEGKTYIPIREGFGLYKFSDMVLSDEDLLGAMVTHPDYPEKAYVITSDIIGAMSNDVVQIRIERFSIIFVRKDNADVGGITFQEKGVYATTRTAKGKITKENNITPMSADFLPNDFIPKNLKVVFSANTGQIPTSCNVTYDELRGWVENDIPVLSVLRLTEYSRTDIISCIMLRNSSTLECITPAGHDFIYNSDGTLSKAGLE